MEIRKTNGKCCRWFGWNIVGVIFMAFGLSLLIFFPDFFHNQLMKNLELTLEARAYPEWKAPTVPLYMDVYMFNWTNPHEIKNKSTKPSFEQIGPYRFREFPDKVNIKFDATNSTVNYRKFSSYFFDPDGSNGSLSDLCTTLNMVAIGSGNRAQAWNFFLQKGVSITLSRYKQEIHVTKTVEELLFEGYEDDMLQMSSMFDNDTPFDRVGLLVKKNATDILSGTYGVNTGVGDISLLGKVATYNGLTEFPFYEGECKKLKGSAGEFFHPNPSTNEPIYLFAPDMCRSIPYDYEHDIELHGLKGFRYAAGARSLDNGTIYDENKCFASSENVPSGVMNISVCNYGHPMFISYPHFYGADEHYLEGINGLKPEKDKHQAFITLEETTGITLEVTARFQTNILLKPYGDYISLFQNMPRIFMPVFWVEQKFVLDSIKAGDLRFGLSVPCIGQFIGIFLLLTGIILMSVGQLKKIFCGSEKSSSLLSKLEANENKAVIKDHEMNPLMSTVQMTTSCCK